MFINERRNEQQYNIEKKITTEMMNSTASTLEEGSTSPSLSTFMVDVDTTKPKPPEDEVVSVDTDPSLDSADLHAFDVMERRDAAAQQKKKRKSVLVGGLVAVILVVAIVLGVTLRSNSNGKSTSASSSSSSVTNNGAVETTSTSTSTSSVASKPVATKPFPDVAIAEFETGNIVAGYDSDEELELDLTLMAMDMINKIVVDILDTHNSANSANTDNSVQNVAEAAGVTASMASATSVQTTRSKVKKVSLTNNLEKDSDEADIVKNDERFVYLGYGDYVVVYDKNGTLVAQEKITIINPWESRDTTDDDSGLTSPAFIEAIQLTESHIIVLGYGFETYAKNDIATGVGATFVRVFTKPTTDGASVKLVAQKNLDGHYSGSQYLLPDEDSSGSGQVHITTTADFTVYESLVEPLELHYFESMDQAEYVQAAKTKAEEQVIPQFVARMMSWLKAQNHGALPIMTRLNDWKTSNDASTTHDYYGAHAEGFQTYTMITTIDVANLPTQALDMVDMKNGFDETRMPTSAAIVIGPMTSETKSYMTQDSIVIHLNRYQWDEQAEKSTDTLFLFHLIADSDNKQVSFQSVTSIPGILAHEHAIDIQGNDLRVATTLQKWSPLDNVWAVCGDSWFLDDACMTEELWQTCFDTVMECKQVTKQGCPYTFTCDQDPSVLSEEEKSSTDNHVIVYDLVASAAAGKMVERGRVRIGEPHELVTAVKFSEQFSYAMTFDERDPFYILDLTEGQAPAIKSILKLDGFARYLQPLNEDATLLVGIGQNVSGTGLDMGPSGLLVSVFDVANPEAPEIVASDMIIEEVNVSATSEAEYDYKAIQYYDGLLVLPLAISSNNGGWRRRLQEEEPLTMVYDESTMEDDLEVNMQTDALPESYYFDNQFDGFVVLNITKTQTTGQLEEVTRINHAVSSDTCYYCNGGSLAHRSFLFESGQLMTMYGSQVVSTDIRTGETMWNNTITFEGEDMSCGCW